MNNTWDVKSNVLDINLTYNGLIQVVKNLDTLSNG